MPTIEGKFESLIAFFQETLAQPCLQCEGRGRRVRLEISTVECTRCEGTGRRELGKDFVRVCVFCDGTGQTEEADEVVGDCDCEEGVLRVHRNADVIAAPLLASCVVTMYDAREGGDFATADLVLEWAVRYVSEKVKAELEHAQDNPEAREALVSMVKNLADSKPVELGTKLVGGALSQEELDDLLADGPHERNETK